MPNTNSNPSYKSLLASAIKKDFSLFEKELKTILFAKSLANLDERKKEIFKC